MTAPDLSHPVSPCTCAAHDPPQLYTIHDITCGPAFKAAAVSVLTEAEAEVDEGMGLGGHEHEEPAILVLDTWR